MILNKIKEDLKTAMKAQDVPTRELLKVIIGEANRVGKEVADNEMIAILKKMNENAKTLNNLEEISIIEQYLPKMLTEAELNDAIDSIISENNLTDMKGMGIVMGQLKAKYGSTYDGKLASTLVKNKLS